jgi:hypothetical protein
LCNHRVGSTLTQPNRVALNFGESYLHVSTQSQISLSGITYLSAKHLIGTLASVRIALYTSRRMRFLILCILAFKMKTVPTRLGGVWELDRFDDVNQFEGLCTHGGVWF